MRIPFQRAASIQMNVKPFERNKANNKGHNMSTDKKRDAAVAHYRPVQAVVMAVIFFDFSLTIASFADAVEGASFTSSSCGFLRGRYLSPLARLVHRNLECQWPGFCSEQRCAFPGVLHGACRSAPWPFSTSPGFGTSGKRSEIRRLRNPASCVPPLAFSR